MNINISKTLNKSNSENIISDFDIYLFHEGRHYEAYRFMGAHLTSEGGTLGTRFTTWAPNAKAIHVVGSFNSWTESEDFAMEKISSGGLWSIFIPGIKEGELYKYAVTSISQRTVFKSDPYGFLMEKRPDNASITVKNSTYKWCNESWMKKIKSKDNFSSPINIYEVHPGSWKRRSDGDFLTYRELGDVLPKYAREMGYTHIELLPVMEHPLDDSWGYQVTGYYSVTSRFGTFEDFKYFIDCCHREDIGVILDWVPGHFCKDENGLYMFDGTNTYEYADLNRRENRGWGAANFDLGRPEVKSFLISNALFYIKEFHIDGLRVDAVSNMLYLDYDRNEGEWTPNKYGGKENLEAIGFLRELNSTVSIQFPHIMMIAEESTSWPMVTKPVHLGGLGFNFKWNMGWMNDSLHYIQLDPVYRKYNHKNITFSMMYNYSENYILPISHDEVVHGKKSLVDKMWGEYNQKFSTLRLFLVYMYSHPGKKISFMGNEFAQFIEWRHYEGLEWKLIDEFEMHRKTQEFFKRLNHIYKSEEALFELDYDPFGFQWIDANNYSQSMLVFMRRTKRVEDTLIIVCNFTPVAYDDYNIGVPCLGEYEELLNTDSLEFGGLGFETEKVLKSRTEKWHNQKYLLNLKIPPMASIILKVRAIDENNMQEDC